MDNYEDINEIKGEVAKNNPTWADLPKDASSVFKRTGYMDYGKSRQVAFGNDPRLNGFGTSRYDPTSINPDVLDQRSLEDIRATNQGTLSV